jgi:hypothetical protein
MARNPKIKKCKTCGTILSSKDRLKRVLSESDEALERYYNKFIRKKK